MPQQWWQGQQGQQQPTGQLQPGQVQGQPTAAKPDVPWTNPVAGQPPQPQPGPGMDIYNPVYGGNAIGGSTTGMQPWPGQQPTSGYGTYGAPQPSQPPTQMPAPPQPPMTPGGPTQQPGQPPLTPFDGVPAATPWQNQAYGDTGKNSTADGAGDSVQNWW